MRYTPWRFTMYPKNVTLSDADVQINCRPHSAPHTVALLEVSYKPSLLSNADIHMNRWTVGAPHIHTHPGAIYMCPRNVTLSIGCRHQHQLLHRRNSLYLQPHLHTSWHYTIKCPSSAIGLTSCSQWREHAPFDKTILCIHGNGMGFPFLIQVWNSVSNDSWQMRWDNDKCLCVL